MVSVVKYHARFHRYKSQSEDFLGDETGPHEGFDFESGSLWGKMLVGSMYDVQMPEQDSSTISSIGSLLSGDGNSRRAVEYGVLPRRACQTPNDALLAVASGCGRCASRS